MNRHGIGCAGDFSGIAPGDHYYLLNSIDCSECALPTVPEFSGIFDFCGFTLSNLDRPLFGFLGSAVVKSLFLQDASAPLAQRSSYCRFHRISAWGSAEAALSLDDDNSQFFMCVSNRPLCGATACSIFNGCVEEAATIGGTATAGNEVGKQCQSCGFVGQCAHALFEQLSGRLELRLYQEEQRDRDIERTITELGHQLSQNSEQGAAAKNQESGLGESVLLRLEALENAHEKLLKENLALKRSSEEQEMQIAALSEAGDNDILRALYCQLFRLYISQRQPRELVSLLLMTAHSHSQALGRSLAHHEVLNSDFLSEEALSAGTLTDCLLFTPLHYAVLLGKPAIVDELVTIGAAGNAPSGLSALMLAAMSGNASFVSKLAPLECDIRAEDGSSALDMAEDLECIEILRRCQNE